MLLLRVLRPARQEALEAAQWYRADDQKIARAFVEEIDRTRQPLHLFSRAHIHAST